MSVELSFASWRDWNWQRSCPCDEVAIHCAMRAYTGPMNKRWHVTPRGCSMGLRGKAKQGSCGIAERLMYQAKTIPEAVRQFEIAALPHISAIVYELGVPFENHRDWRESKNTAGHYYRNNSRDRIHFDHPTNLGVSAACPR